MHSLVGLSVEEVFVLDGFESLRGEYGASVSVFGCLLWVPSMGHAGAVMEGSCQGRDDSNVALGSTCSSRCGTTIVPWRLVALAVSKC